MAHTLPELGYEYDALEPFVDAETMKIHHDKHHQAYVDKLNAAINGKTDLENKNIEDLLRNIGGITMSYPAEVISAIKNHGGGHVNHSLFWKLLKKDGGQPSEELIKAMLELKDSPQEFHDAFVDAGMKQFGSGWVWVVVNSEKKLEIISTSNQDSPLMQNKTPILGIDVWEHAYYLKYQSNRKDYLEAITKVINWEKVNELYAEAVK